MCGMRRCAQNPLITLKPAMPKDRLNRHRSIPNHASLLEYQSCSDWMDFKKKLKRRFCLADVCVAVRPNTLQSESIDALDKVLAVEDSGDEVYISISVGLRASLDVSFVRSKTGVSENAAWPPKAEYLSILLEARELFCRSVRDHVVGVMSGENRDAVVSFFLDSAGAIDSVSKRAQVFCDRFLPVEARVNSYFGATQWNYMQGGIGRLKATERRGSRNESLVFCLGMEKGIVHCLLQKMGSNGYLLSLSVDS